MDSLRRPVASADTGWPQAGHVAAMCLMLMRLLCIDTTVALMRSLYKLGQQQYPVL